MRIHAISSPLNSLLLAILLVTSNMTLLAQETTCFDVVLKKGTDHPDVTVQSFDSATIGQSWKQPVKRFYNVKEEKGSFRLTCIPTGRYMLYLSTKEVGVAPLPVTVCSKCENVFSFSVHPLKEGENNFVFESVEISPVYLGGVKVLADDFKSGLSKKERKLVSKSDAFRVRFYVTKSGEVSDPAFMPSSLPPDIKESVTKGLAGLRKWRPAEVNGHISDAEYTLTKRELLYE